jgi:hypothetical protein
MASESAVGKREELLAILRKLVDQFDIVWVEKEAVERLAISKGATYPEVERVKEDALADPEIRRETREQFGEMWKALEVAGIAAVYEETLRDLPPPERPN